MSHPFKFTASTRFWVHQMRCADTLGPHVPEDIGDWILFEDNRFCLPLGSWRQIWRSIVPVQRSHEPSVLACFKRQSSNNTYRSDQPVCKPSCVINKYRPFTWGACFFWFVRIRRLVHLLEIVTDVKSAIKRAKFSSVCGHIDLIFDGWGTRDVTGQVACILYTSVRQIIQADLRNRVVIITPNINVFFFITGHSSQIRNHIQADGQIIVKTYRIGIWGRLIIRSMARISLFRDSGHNVTIESPGMPPFSSVKGCCRSRSTALPNAVVHSTEMTQSSMVEGKNWAQYVVRNKGS